MPLTFAALIASIDPSNTGAAYHFQLSPNLSGGRLVSLPDALGRSGVPALIGGGSPLPLYDTTNGITTDGSQNYLDSGLSSRFDFSTGPLTVIYCGTSTAPGHSLIVHEDTNSRWFSVGRLSSLDSFVRSQNGGGSTGNASAQTPFAFDSSPHLYVAQLSETARATGYGWFGLVADPYPRYVRNGDDVTVTTNMPAGQNHLEFGRLSGAGQFNADTLRWLIVLRKDVTLAALRLVRQFAASDTACLPFTGSSLRRAIYIVGDSLTYGLKSSDPTTKSPAARLAASEVINGFEWRNWAQGGRRATTWQAQ